MSWRNWGRNVSARPSLFATPLNTEDIVDLVVAHPQVTPVGSGHSFTPIAATRGVQIDLRHMRNVVEHRPGTGRVRVQAGITLRELNRELHARGLALPNLGDVDSQTVAGAIATGTHGTGAALGSLSTAVVGAQIVTGDGTVVDIDEDHPWMNAVRTNLGALGIIAELELACVPRFLLHAQEAPMPLSKVLDQLDELVAANDHFEFFWFPHTTKTLTKRNNRVASDASSAPLSPVRRLIDDELISNVAFEQVQRLVAWKPVLTERINSLSGSLLGPRSYTDYSHRVFASPRRVRFREMEFALPRSHARQVLGELQRWFSADRERVSFPIEVRFTAADDIWMSTGYQRDNVHIAVHQYHRTDYRRYFGAMQAIFASHEGRPHWGKLHHLDSSYFASHYPQFDAFLAVRNELDPERKFVNEHIAQVLG